MKSDVVASIRARLLAVSKATGEEFERTLVRYAIERLLFRIGSSKARDQCVLKGANLLAVWLPDPVRATRDLDVLASGDPSDDGIRRLLEGVCAVSCPEDGVHFDLSKLRIDEIRADDEYSGKRARFPARLGSARISVQVDIGFGDAVVPAPEEITVPTLLDRLPAPRLRAYPREASIAEKCEAMIKLDIRNSRMKDFHDVWALSGSFAFDGATLRRAIVACFERRATPWTMEVPRPLTADFYRISELARRWSSYLAAGAVLVPPPTEFGVIGERINAFLRPIRDSVVNGSEFEHRWTPAGGWV